MGDLSDMPELEDLNVESGFSEDNIAVDLKGSGIDLNELKADKDIEFEVDPTSVDPINDEHRYFDQEELFKQLNYECIDTGCDSEDEKITPFERMRRDMNDITGDGGVLKSILKHGAGSIVPSKALCRVHYNGYLEYSDEPFDSSRLRGRQHQFKLSSGESILGWEIGVATMKRGEIARFMFSSNYAYGKMGCPPRIPAGATILFEIELISFVDQAASDAFENFSEEERKKASFDEILKVVDSLRMIANEAFQINQTGRAAGKYSQALRLLENTNLKDESEERKMKQAALKLYLNLSLCDLKQVKSGRACKYARKALDIDAKNVKALFRLARALRQLGQFDDARRQISKAHRLNPGNNEVLRELHLLDDDMKKHRKANQELSRKMLNLNTQAKAVEKIKQPSVQCTQMVDLLKERLKTFVTEKNSPQLMLPNTLTDEEISSIKKAAEDMNLYVNVSEQGTLKSIYVSKEAFEEAPHR